MGVGDSGDVGDWGSHCADNTHKLVSGVKHSTKGTLQLKEKNVT